jgi:hypothetical protein
MLNQAREFNDTVPLTGLILTKLDGSARGGAVVSVVDQLGLPVKFVGVGEALEDLQVRRRAVVVVGGWGGGGGGCWEHGARVTVFVPGAQVQVLLLSQPKCSGGSTCCHFLAPAA